MSNYPDMKPIIVELGFLKFTKPHTQKLVYKMAF